MKFFEDKVVNAESKLKRYVLHILLTCFVLAILISIFIIKDNLASKALILEVKISLFIPCLALISLIVLSCVFSKLSKSHMKEYHRVYDAIIKAISWLLIFIFSSIIVTVFSFFILGLSFIINDLNTRDIIIYVYFIIVAMANLILTSFGCVFAMSGIKTIKEYKINFQGKLNFLEFINRRMSEIINKFVLITMNVLGLLDKMFKITLSINDFVKIGLAPSIVCGFFIIPMGWFAYLQNWMDNSIRWFILGYGVAQISFVLIVKLVETVFGIKVKKSCRKIICINYYVIRFINTIILSVATIYGLATIYYWLMQYNSQIIQLVIEQTIALFLLALGYCGLSHQMNKIMIILHTNNGRL